jgi:membrane-bound serine protease (ClpP class)
MAVRARRRPIVSGVESLVGADGEMLDDATDTGWANINGETWQVKTDARVTRGQKVRVVAVDGVRLRVAPAGD